MGCPWDGDIRVTYGDAFRVARVDGGAVVDQPLRGLYIFDSIERRISVFVGYIDVPS